MIRLFAAISPPPVIIRQLSTLQKGVPHARWVDPAQFHITLGFFDTVEMEKVESLDQELSRIHTPYFDLSLQSVGHFGKATPHSLWAGLAPSAALDDLHKAVRGAARRASIHMPARQYKPHITLAYLRSFPDISDIIKFETTHNELRSDPFCVDQFHLFSVKTRSKNTNLYICEADYPLGL